MVTEGPPLDQSEVRRVWNGLTSAERLYRYYSRLAERFSRINQVFMFTIGVLSLVAVALQFADLPSEVWWVPAVPAFMAGCLSMWASYAVYSRKAGIASSIAGLCADLRQDWEDLWYDLYSSGVRERASALERQETRITMPASLDHGFWDDELNCRCEREAYEYCVRAYNYA